VFPLFPNFSTNEPVFFLKIALALLSSPFPSHFHFKIYHYDLKLHNFPIFRIIYRYRIVLYSTGMLLILTDGRGV
jgi:hypothetical protein